jgi:dTMP kinase
LYSAARAQLIEEIVEPALKDGTIVLCDRFLDSTIAYQGYGGGLGLSLIKRVGRVATGGIKPDLTLLLDFWQSVAHLKNQKEPDRIESRSEAYHELVRKGYFALAKGEPERIKVVRVSDNRDDTQKEIRELVQLCLSKKYLAKKSR